VTIIGMPICGIGQGANGLKINRDFSLNHDATLQALRVVLSLPKRPLVFDDTQENNKRSGLAITLDRSVHVP
jgi:hypothetical protein